MKIAVLTLASALALVLAGTTGVEESAPALAPESAVEAFSRSGSSGRDTILLSAERVPGVSLAVSVAVPGLGPGDVASARVVFKRGGEAVVGVPLGVATEQGRVTFQGLVPDAGEWDTALVLVEKSDRALLVKEFEKAGIDLPIPAGTLPVPVAPAKAPAARALGAGERVAMALELVIKEALLLPAPLEGLLFGS